MMWGEIKTNPVDDLSGVTLAVGGDGDRLEAVGAGVPRAVLLNARMNCMSRSKSSMTRSVTHISVQSNDLWNEFACQMARYSMLQHSITHIFRVAVILATSTGGAGNHDIYISIEFNVSAIEGKTYPPTS